MTVDEKSELVSGEVLPAQQLPAKVPRDRALRLQSFRDVRRELARVYNAMRKGRLDSREGTRRAFVLTQITKVIQLEIVEQRLDLLEERIDEL